jgi:hypothetical protein
VQVIVEVGVAARRFAAPGRETGERVRARAARRDGLAAISGHGRREESSEGTRCGRVCHEGLARLTAADFYLPRFRYVAPRPYTREEYDADANRAARARAPRHPA